MNWRHVIKASQKLMSHIHNTKGAEQKILVFALYRILSGYFLDDYQGGNLLRIDEAADFLTCSNQHVRNLADMGELEAVNIGSTIDPDEQQRVHKRITSRSVELFINKRRKAV